ncbi:MAG: NfeD family protein [Thermoguttaceae bacterium]
MLQPPAAHSEEPEGKAADEPALGDLGVADSALRPAGRARFGHRMLDVMTDGEFIDRGRRVEIVRISGRRVFVAPAKKTEPPAPARSGSMRAMPREPCRPIRCIRGYNAGIA